MKVLLPVSGFAVAGAGADWAGPARQVLLPPPGFQPRRPRLPELAVELARRALGSHVPTERTAVLFGTALGCLTETAAFLENLLAQDEATPLPRAFTASVHNAVAGRVAQALGCRGECHTFSQGATSIAAALFQAAARRPPGEPALVGAADEWTPYVGRARQACGGDAVAAEGGAVLAVAAGPPLALVTGVDLGRPQDVLAWWAARVPRDAPDAVRLDVGSGPGTAGADHPSAAALTVALAVGLLAGEVSPARVRRDRPPVRVDVAIRSRLGDVAWIGMERAR